jgi:hypothetical protein
MRPPSMNRTVNSARSARFWDAMHAVGGGQLAAIERAVAVRVVEEPHLG